MGAAESTSKDPPEADLFDPEQLVELRLAFASLAKTPGMITKEALASLPPFVPADALFSMMRDASAQSAQADGLVSWAGFVCALGRCARAPRAQRMQALFDLYAEQGALSSAAARQMLRDALACCCASSQHAAAAAAASFESVLRGMALHAGDARAMQQAEWSVWVTSLLPWLPRCLEYLVTEPLCCVGRAHAAKLPPSELSKGTAVPRSAEYRAPPPLMEPVLNYANGQVPSRSLLGVDSAWLLDLVMAGGTGVRAGEEREWKCLYSSDIHGLSLNRFEANALGYAGPTLLLVRCSDGSDKLTLGALVDSPWKASEKFFGGNRSFLLQLEPAFHAYKAIGIASNFAFFNAPQAGMLRGAAHLTTSTAPNTIGFGGQTARFRMGFEDDLRVVRWHNSCTTYAAHPSAEGNLDEKARKVEVLELWGCGGVAAEKAQRELRDRAQKDANRAGKVDRAAMFGGGGGGWNGDGAQADRMILEAAGAHTFYSEQLEKLPRDAKEGK